MKHTENQDKKLFEECELTWGKTFQTTKAMEEAAEFIKATSKYFREPSLINLNALADEIADLRLMLGQIEHSYGLQRHCAYAKAKKIQIIKERLKAS